MSTHGSRLSVPTLERGNQVKVEPRCELPYQPVVKVEPRCELPYQPVVKVEPRCERSFSAESSFENLADTRIACGFPALIRRKIPRSRRRLTFTTG